MSFDIYVAELNGYLKAIQRLCGGAYVFGATHFSASKAIDESIQTLIETWDRKNRLSYVNKTDVDYDELMTDITYMIFNGFLGKNNISSDQVNAYLVRTISEDIQEYYGLVSTSINSHGIFHPLIENQKYKLNITCDDFDKYLFFIVEIEDIFLLTYFYKKRKMIDSPRRAQ